MDLAHYLEEYHVSLPTEFVERVRGLGYRMPDLDGATFGPIFDEAMPALGWGGSPSWNDSSIWPAKRSEVATSAEYLAAVRRTKPDVPGAKRPRKARWPKG